MHSQTQSKSSWLSRLFPRGTDFYALLNEQCDLLDQGADALLAFMQTDKTDDADRVRQLEHQGDVVKSRNMDLLHRAFATPMDREDIFRAIDAIDNVLNYAKSTVREMSILGVPPDEHTLAMAQWLKTGAEAIKEGFSWLETQPLQAEQCADKARKTERHIEKIYRRALAELFDPGHYLDTTSLTEQREAHGLAPLLEQDGPIDNPDEITASVAFILEIMKRREVYRHLSNAADRVVAASDVLHDIVVKST